MPQTHFGFETVDETAKAARVRGVFDSVAPRYDLMNDLLSFGMHRLWKRYAVAVADVRPGMRVLDVASGTGDMARAFVPRVGAQGLVVAVDINASMLALGRDRLIDDGVVAPPAVCDAERLPFPDGAFDRVCVAFGLRNMTRIEQALREFARVTADRGRLLVLEFSRIAEPLQRPYDWYSFRVMPCIGKVVAGDSQSYRYLAESIRMHPAQGELKAMLKRSGFGHVEVHNLAAGAVALHVGIKC